MEQDCPHFRMDRAPLVIAPHGCQGYVPVETCDLAPTLMRISHECSVWLAYGPDGGLVCRHDCTVERMKASCRPAVEGSEPSA